jgi:hypothetical protein
MSLVSNTTNTVPRRVQFVGVISATGRLVSPRDVSPCGVVTSARPAQGPDKDLHLTLPRYDQSYEAIAVTDSGVDGAPATVSQSATPIAEAERPERDADSRQRNRPRPAAAVADSYADLRRQVRAAGLLDRSYGYYLLLALSLTAALALLGGMIWQWPGIGDVIAVPALAFLMMQIGLIAHDAGHNQIFSRPGLNRIVGLICMPAFLASASRTGSDCTTRTTLTPTRLTRIPISMSLSSYSHESRRV